MNTTVVAAFVTLIIGLGGGYLFGHSQTSASRSHDMPTGTTMTNTMAGMTAELDGKIGDAFDTAFIEGMIIHHEGAVAMAHQALQSAKHAEIKELSQNIIDAQTREIATMRGWLQSWYGVTSVHE